MSRRSSFEDVGKVYKRLKTNYASFPLGNNYNYEGSFPIYKQPQELVSYSIDHERRVWFDDRELKYYSPPNEDDDQDLNIGYEKMIKRDDSIPEHIDTLLDALTFYNTENKNTTTADIVTWRGIMTKLMCTPYSRKEAWTLRATRYKDTIYIEEEKKEEEKMTEKQKLMSYWGYRFETLYTKPYSINDKEDDDDKTIVNTNIQYCTVVKTKLGNNSIIMGAEVDCCNKEKSKQKLENYIELKTSRIIESKQNLYSFERYKLLKFWAQSFLVGVPKIICGFRNDEGRILNIKEYKTLEIPRLIRNKPNLWNPSVCLNFANELLNWIRLKMTENDATLTYLIEFKYPFKEINLTNTGHSHVFLTQRFINGTIQHDIGGERAATTAATAAIAAEQSAEI
ncbi:RAI1 like PD-XK nuclease-domain-containing protein [Cokeromyces recurvatus]|uniref:RAI1 like PD-XK nuclease-domain-containing protein n=1 Tax=Cokeromyces recurvatus TaxID=90255 RepID=UPI00222081E3|nr:RAI1 like PD-XK nuclease-domain-containing protein [Cokeromyces recurvatus]KAI7897652.1 RAI1 like PD-XK nuclease-domain-containing protein [Cokeromyces recurvatus]